MKRLYDKSQLWFALVWIIVYVVGTSAADSLGKGVTLPFHIILTLVALIWVKRNSLLSYYGLCKTRAAASKFLYYLPLIVLSSCNLWFDMALNMPVSEAILYVGSMLCVGFLEELIFRGFLFRAMARDSLKAAIIVSSLTFGIGHLVNLVNGSGADLLSNLCQVCYATAFGFLFVTIFYRGGSLLPCIIAHSVVNASSVLFDAASIPPSAMVISSIILTVGAVAYTLVLLRTLPKDVELC